MSANFNENSRVKYPALVHLCSLGYRYMSLKGLKFDPNTNILTDILKQKITAFNPLKTVLEVDQFVDKLTTVLDNDDLGREFYGMLTSVSDFRMIDFDNPSNNDFACVTEFACKNGDDEFRPDITLLINGIPLAFIEVKKPNNKEGILAERDRINKRFSNRRFRRFLNLSQLMLFSNNQEYDTESIVPIQGAFYSTISRTKAVFNCFREPSTNANPADYNFYSAFSYKLVDSKIEEAILKDNNAEVIRHTPEYRTNKDKNTPTNRVITSLFSKERFLFILQYAFAYVDTEKEIENPDGSVEKVRDLQKHIMRYQQLFATFRIEEELDKGTKSGIIWHTQGSGKTALSYYNIRRLTDYYASRNTVPIFYFIVDRLDLLTQSQVEFEQRGLIVNTVNSKDELIRQFRSQTSVNNHQGKLEVTVVNIQKFKEDNSEIDLPTYAINLQRIYFIDEAHRGYAFDGSFLANLFQSDRNAIKIALTGTPLIGEERKSYKAFGNYIDKYYYNQSIADGYTLKLIREEIESNYRMQIEQVLEDVRLKKRDLKREVILADRSYVEAMLDYILHDLKKSRIQLGDKSIAGMIVCDSNQQASMMFKLFNEKQEEHGLRSALILHDQDDKEVRKEYIYSYKKKETLDFLIVNKMLLTGFDAPRLKKLYLGRRIKDHNLLQALTRVNRPYKDFKYGYIVDFADISEDFAATNKAYLEELNKEVGEENMQSFSNLFESSESVIEQMKDIRDTLFGYNCRNAEIFRQQLDEIDDRAKLLELKKSLEQARALGNVVRTFGDDDLKAEFAAIGIDKVNDLYREATHRLDIVNLKNGFQHQDEVGGIINEAMATISFSFHKVGEEELRMLGEDYESEFHAVVREFTNNFDQADEEYITLAQAFKDYFKKRGVEPRDVSQARETIGYMKGVMEKIREINRLNANLRQMYNGDEKFVRVHKRTVERGFISKREAEVCGVLLNLKSTIDDQVLLNSAILKNDPYFESTVKRLVGNGLHQLKINALLQDKGFIADIIATQYLNQYNSSSTITDYQLISENIKNAADQNNIYTLRQL
ncbi:MAG: type I restriction endonuclease [Bacteroidales bacterium]